MDKNHLTRSRGLKEITNTEDVINSRDIIARIGYLDDVFEECNEEEKAELKLLKALAEEGEGCPDWRYGGTLIRESYFTDYIEELICDCYSSPKEMESGNWPWRHMSIDYEAAAKEAETDYTELDFDGVKYLIQS